MRCSDEVGERLLDPSGNLRFIHRVDMDMRAVIGKQIHNLLRRIDDACLLHSLGIIPKFIHDGAEAVGVTPRSVLRQNTIVPCATISPNWHTTKPAKECRQLSIPNLLT